MYKEQVVALFYGPKKYLHITLSVMCLGSAEWWLDHKGTENPQSPGM